MIAGLLRVALSFRSRRKTGRLRLYIATAESDPTPTLIVHRGDGASAITVFSGSEEGSNSSRPKIRVDQMHSETDRIMTKGIR